MIRYCIKRFRVQDGITYYTTESDAETPYFGWLDNEGKINYVFPSFVLLDICFPYGVLAEEKTGRGKIIKVIISEIGQIDNKE